MLYLRILKTASSVCFLFIFFCSLTFSCTSFDTGKEFYLKSDFDNALIEWKKCLPSENTALFYNLGNVFFKKEQYGLARLWYEKGLKLSPRDRNLQFNLKLLKEKLEDMEEDITLSQSVLSRQEALFSLAMIALISALLFLLRFRIGTLFYKAGMISFFIVIILLWKKIFLSMQIGVILQKETGIYSNQNIHSAVLLKVHEGKLLKVIDRVGNWYLVEVKKGVRGWLPEKVLGLV
jgi:tetratricopeptide (TPR) repeat protein